jgi:hypothetical protein
MGQTRELEDISEDRSTHEQIEQRAYEIYLKQHNGEEGHALEDWLIAEDEVRQARTKDNTTPLRNKAVAAGQQRTR